MNFFRRKFWHFVFPLVLIPFGIGGYVLSEYGNAFTQEATCGVIFGAAVWKDDVPSHALYDRTMAGIQLLKDNQVECLILSGGASRYGSHEVEVMQSLAQEQKIPAQKIQLDFAGTNTVSTLKNLPKNTDFVFISNDFHLARIQLLAWKLNIEDFDLHAASYLNGRYQKEPYFFVREIGGILWYGLQSL